MQVPARGLGTLAKRLKSGGFSPLLFGDLSPFIVSSDP